MSQNSSIARIEAHIPNMHGWCTVEKAKDMAEIILREKPLCCVEIGVFAGRSLVAQAFALEDNKKGFIFGIDPWSKQASLEGSNTKENDKWWSEIDYDFFYRYTLQQIDLHGLTDYCIICRTTSEAMAPVFANEAVDILHIDGNHSEETSCLDVELWFPKVKSGGHIFFDDVNWTSTNKAIGLLKSLGCQPVLERESYAFFLKT